MKLVVTVWCVDCGRNVEVHMIGAWDIKSVRHQCTGLEESGLKPGEFDVTYSPPRSTF